jgi:DNA-binding YbaB/EbfC family protein
MPGIDLNYFIRQANKLTEKIEKRKTELAAETHEHKAAEGRVTVVVTGAHEVKSIKIDPAVVDPADLSMLEDLLTAAVNGALASSREHEKRELAKVSGGVKIPGVT